jgi:hypothetical protein
MVLLVFGESWKTFFSLPVGGSVRLDLACDEVCIDRVFVVPVFEGTLARRPGEPYAAYSEVESVVAERLDGRLPSQEERGKFVARASLIVRCGVRRPEYRAGLLTIMEKHVVREAVKQALLDASLLGVVTSCVHNSVRFAGPGVLSVDVLSGREPLSWSGGSVPFSVGADWEEPINSVGVAHATGSGRVHVGNLYSGRD